MKIKNFIKLLEWYDQDQRLKFLDMGWNLEEFWGIDFACDERFLIIQTNTPTCPKCETKIKDTEDTNKFSFYCEKCDKEIWIENALNC